MHILLIYYDNITLHEELKEITFKKLLVSDSIQWQPWATSLIPLLTLNLDNLITLEIQPVYNTI